MSKKKNAIKREPKPDPQPKPSGAELARDAVDAKNPAEQKTIEEAIAELSPEEAEMFVRLLERAMTRRKLQLFGYLAALFGLLTGMMFALYMYGTRSPGEFVHWVWLVPFGLAGVTLFTFGRLAARYKMEEDEGAGPGAGPL